MKHCPTCTCGQHDDTAPVDELREQCRAAGHQVLAGDWVTVAVAAQLLGKSPGTLLNWRAGVAPRGITLVGRRVGGQVQFSLAEIAAVLSAHDE